MKKLVFLILVFLSILLFSGISAAQSQSMERIHADLHRTLLHKNLTDLSALLAKMSDVIAKGDLEPEHEAKCAEILMNISHMMVEMAGSPGNATYKKQQNQIEKLKKEWDAWEEMEQH